MCRRPSADLGSRTDVAPRRDKILLADDDTYLVVICSVFLFLVGARPTASNKPVQKKIGPYRRRSRLGKLRRRADPLDDHE